MSLPNSAFLKGVGIFVILIGFVEIGVGAEVWAFAPGVKYGSWWAAMVAVVAGLVAVIASNKLHLKVLIFFSSAASILTFSGMLVDSFGYRRVNELETCVDTTDGSFSGASGLEPEAAQCGADFGKLCGCVGDRGVCHNFDINHYRQQNCELILTRYTDLLLVSLIFTAFTLAWVFLLSVIACVTYSTVVQSENPAAHQTIEKSTPIAAGDVEAAILAPATPAPAPAGESPKAVESPKKVESVTSTEAPESSI